MFVVNKYTAGECLLGVDSGGTFTDFVLFADGEIRIHKVLSTPEHPEQAILQGIAELDLQPEGLAIVHGTTVATNAALEGKGARTLLIQNQGFADLLNIGRQARKSLYKLQPQDEQALMPADLCLQIDTRMAANGETVKNLSDESLQLLRQQVEALQPQAVAINLLYSWLDDATERVIEANLPESVFVSRSSEVLPQIREYERGAATWLNAWLGPLVAHYLQNLQAQLPASCLSVMQSSGETLSARQAERKAVHLLLSGPAGGLQGARHVCAMSSEQRLLSFDMGGTSTDVAIIEGQPRLTSEGFIGPYPVAVPMLEMHTIGAGGGSIARVDAGGMLLLGPQSAGADPGPACYARGGQQATVTDAHVFLGHLPASVALGGSLKLEPQLAGKVIERLALQLCCTSREAAEGILALANEHMLAALRKIALQAGVDQRDYTLVSFGGAGGLHVCELAESLGIKRAVVPVHAGVLSALGMLLAQPGRTLTQTWQQTVDTLDEAELQHRFECLQQRALRSLLDEGICEDIIHIEQSLDMRYCGQAYSLNIAESDIRQAEIKFHASHKQLYGHDLQQPVEIVNLQVIARAKTQRPSLPRYHKKQPGEPQAWVHVLGVDKKVAVYQRNQLAYGQVCSGPAILLENVSTIWVAPGWQAEVDKYASLVLQHMACQEPVGFN